MRLTTKTGILTGLSVATWLLAGYSFLTALSTGIPKVTLRTLTGILGLVILFIGILYAMRKSKKANTAGSFSFITAFQSGFIVTVIVALIVSFASFLYVKFINPGLADDMVREAGISLKTSGATAQEVSQKLAAVRKEFSIQAQLLAPLIVQTVAGSIFSLILAFFLRDKNKLS